MISVCMASYNGEKYIREQIDSVLPQLGPADELIVSDDGSSDRTAAIVESYGDPRIRLLHGSFHSPVFNFENALKAAQGDVIFLCDQDDIWKPDKVAVTLAALADHDCVVSDAAVVDAERRVLAPSFMEQRGSRPGQLANLIRNRYLGCCMAFNRKILDAALPFPKDIPMHDIWIGAVAERFGKPVFLHRVLMEYRRHGDNASPTAEKSPYTFRQKLAFRAVILKELHKRTRERGLRHMRAKDRR